VPTTTLRLRASHSWLGMISVPTATPISACIGHRSPIAAPFKGYYRNRCVLQDRRLLMKGEKPTPPKTRKGKKNSKRTNRSWFQLPISSEKSEGSSNSILLGVGAVASAAASSPPPGLLLLPVVVPPPSTCTTIIVRRMYASRGSAYGLVDDSLASEMTSQSRCHEIKMPSQSRSPSYHIEAGNGQRNSPQKHTYQCVNSILQQDACKRKSMRADV
jgi:hypothetical protein